MILRMILMICCMKPCYTVRNARESDSARHAVADCFCANSMSFRFRWKIANKIKAVKIKFATIAKDRSDMNNAIGHNVPMNQQPIDSRDGATRVASLLTNVEDSNIPTRDQEKERIIRKLLESNVQEDCWIVSVVGLGGSGKTTLAKHICHDNKVKGNFEDIFWVHVSQEFDTIKLIGKLFQAITKEKSDLHAPQHMVEEISRKTTGKKFLLVLDDAWHEDKDDWNEFMVHLQRRAPGSKLMITTRDRKVAEAVKSGHIFKLAFLKEVESWSLFLKSSGRKEDDLGSEFIAVGQGIVKKCGGVPLAIKVLGGILSDNRKIITWEAIRESDLWNEENIEDRVFASLKLSYIHLKDHLKQCFTFCSIFPKGYRISQNYLIEQWIAHGLIKLTRGEPLEATGNEYFDSLVKVGFLVQSGFSSNGTLCKMHDLIHDLTRYILRRGMVTSLPMNKNTHCIHKCRYLSVTSGNSRVDRGSFDEVRALYISEVNPSFDKIYKKSRYICSVVLNYATYTPFPLFILKLEYLGYLEVHNITCTELPDAMSGCWNLQSLHFIDCKGFVTLPNSVGKLTKLRKVELTGVRDLVCLPLSIGGCRDLQWLRIKFCTNFREIPNTIGKNENLRTLEISYCSNVQQLPSILNGEFGNIDTINLAGCGSLQGLPSTFPPCRLRTLNLSKTRVNILPEWILLLDTLECIYLRDCSALLQLPPGIVNLRRLKVLDVSGCLNLSCMPSGLGQLTHLKSLGLFVVGCGADDATILELENLNKLEGKMEIKNLKYLRDLSDAEKACLKQKNGIKDLKLDWSLSQMEEGSNMEQDLHVLEALEPPSEITTLDISGYRGCNVPCWMMKQSGPYLEGVVSKEPCGPLFPYLIKLKLENLPNLKHMKGMLVWPSLKSLCLGKLPNLEELWTTTSGSEVRDEKGEQYCFPILVELDLIDCPKSIVRPYFPPSLELLELENCNERLLSPDGPFCRLLPQHINEPSSSRQVHAAVPHLKVLHLEGMAESSSGWGFLQHITGLEALEIWCCHDLTELPESMQWLTSLQRLYIYNCSTLAVLPEWIGELQSLRMLSIIECPMMISLPPSIKQLTSLVYLRIHGWGNLKQLPDSIQHLTSLQQLHLVECNALTELPEWIEQLSATLSIEDCSALQSIPNCIDTVQIKTNK